MLKKKKLREKYSGKRNSKRKVQTRTRSASSRNRVTSVTGMKGHGG